MSDALDRMTTVSLSTHGVIGHYYYQEYTGRLATRYFGSSWWGDGSAEG